MAFNPFDVFRRNQRILFAILTVFIMLMFTLSFGAGDFFQQIPRWLGQRTRAGDVLAVVDGSKVYESELQQIQQNRGLANQFMSAAAARAADNLAKYLTENVSRVSAENRPGVEQLLFARRSRYVGQEIMMRAQFGMPVSQDDVIMSRDQTIATLDSQLRTVVGGAATQPADKEVAEAALSLLTLDTRVTGPQGHYFVNQPNRTNRDFLDFYLWEKKADELGIRLTGSDVSELVATEFMRQLTADDVKAIEDGLKQSQWYAPDRVREALANEFRVRVAQTAVMGPAYARGGRGYDSPYEFYDFYRDQTSAGRFGVVALPAENFLDKVTGQPSDSELQALFTRHRNDEPDPRLARPGFREPRKLKLAWLEVKGDEPYFVTKAGELVAKAPAYTALSLALGLPAAHATGAEVLAALMPLAAPDVLLQRQYDEYRRQYADHVRENWFATPFFGAAKPLETSVTKPGNLASLAGVASGMAATDATPWSMAASFAADAIAADRRARLLTLNPTLVAPVLTGPGLLAPVTGTVAAQALATQPPPLAAVRDRMVTQLKQEVARWVATQELEEFQKEMTRLGGGADKSDAVRYAQTFAKTRTLKTGESTNFHDQYTIADDPGLTLLKDKAAGPHGGKVNAIQVGRRFFFDVDPLTRREQVSTGLYKPQSYPSPFLAGPTEQETALMVWRTAELPAETPRTLADPGVRDKVVAAWKRSKARDLAKQAAEAFAKKWDEIRDREKLAQNDVNILRNLLQAQAELRGQFESPAAQDRVDYFELSNVSPLVSSAMPMAGANSVAPFMLTPTDEMPYPTPKMTEELLATRTKPLSTPVVLADEPTDRYYVAVLQGREEKPAELFGLTVYGGLAGRGNLVPAITTLHQHELAKQARDQAVALLKAEFGYEKENAEALDKTTDRDDVQ